jgi:hypothetical protein
MTRYRIMGQAGQVVDCVSEEKLRVVFAMFDADDKTDIAWYVFASSADAATQKACKKYGAYGFWGFRSSVGTFIPVGNKIDIPLDGLAGPYPKGSTASLDLDLTALRVITGTISELKISDPKAKANEILTISFTLEKTSQNPPPNPRASRDPKNPGTIKGKVYFLEFAEFSDKNLIAGPQAKSSTILIDGPVL